MSFLKNIWKSNSRHKKLYEEWALTNIINRDTVNSDVHLNKTTFNVKYLGSTLVDSATSETVTAEAIKTILRVAKASGRKLPRVQLTVCLKGITVSDFITGEDQMDVSIYRISHCSADATHDCVFAFIAANANETMECHAFLCPKRRVTQAVTLTVAQAFNTAYEVWLKHEQQKRAMLVGECSKDSLSSSPSSSSLTPSSTATASLSRERTLEVIHHHHHQHQQQDKSMLIDFDGDIKDKERLHQAWVCFDEAEDNADNRNFAQVKQNSWVEGDKRPVKSQLG